MDENNSYESSVFTLTDEEGNEIDFEVIGQHEMNGEHYVALLPADATEAEIEGDVTEYEYIILKLAEEDGGDFELDDDDLDIDLLGDL